MRDETQNPLLARDIDDGIPFHTIRASHVVPGIDALLDEARARLRAIEEDTSPRTYASTLDALEQVTEHLGTAMGIVAHLEAVATTPELRDAYAAVQPRVSEFSSGLTLSEGMWRALTSFAATGEAKALEGPRRRFLEKTVDDFRRAGAELGSTAKERLSAIDVELSRLALRYAQNVLDATNRFALTVPDRPMLAGLPESAVEAARESAASRGVSGYRLTLQAPSYIPALTYLDDARLRETLYRAYNTRATAGDVDNRPLLGELLALRAEKAQLLGFPTFADLVLADRMAKTGARARAFVRDLRAAIGPFFARENRELEAFRRDAGGDDGTPMMPWDVLYWSEKQRRARFDFDEEALRPYFPLDAVLTGAFEIARRLYGVTIRPWTGAPVWHESVRAYEVTDGGAVVARFYVDVFPRDSKQDGAWMHGMINGVGRTRHLAVFCANVSPPSATGPALLRMREVETLFHEFGHLLHHSLSDVPVRSLAGTNVATDFVELPSKLMENWCWEKSALDLFAKHHETGARIPDDLFAKLRRARTYRAANALMRQLGFAALDLALHDRSDVPADVVAYARDVFAEYSPVALPESFALVASFLHLFADPVGYAAGYYSYPWADVLDADAFTRFKSEGVLSARAGKAFLDAVLARGNSDDPMALYTRFLGREPTPDALLKRLDLAQ